MAELNESQKSAVEHFNGPCLVVGTPGSGKTRVITNRIAYLIEDCGVNPWNIMASRWGLDCNLLGPISIIAICLLFRAEKWYDYIFAGIGLGLVLYTYAISYIIMPVFLVLIVLYMLYTKRISIKNTIIFV